MGLGLLLSSFKALFKKEKAEQIVPGDIVIALVGFTGSGKSTFLKHATGHACAVSHHIMPQNTGIQAIKIPQISSGPSIWLVDTPGIDSANIKLSEQKVLGSVSRFLRQRCSKTKQLDGLLYFHNISSGKIEGEAPSKALGFKKLIEGSFRNVILTTTFWDNSLGPDDIREKERNEVQVGRYWKNIGKDTRQHRFLNTSESAIGIVKLIYPPSEE